MRQGQNYLDAPHRSKAVLRPKVHVLLTSADPLNWYKIETLLGLIAIILVAFSCLVDICLIHIVLHMQETAEFGSLIVKSLFVISVVGNIIMQTLSLFTASFMWDDLNINTELAKKRMHGAI